MASDFMKLRKLYALKKVYRMNSNEDRKESSAEHTWSCLVLADFFMDRMQQKLDRIKVHEMLLYHDVVEIEAGDVPIHHEEKRLGKEERERRGLAKLAGELPSGTGRKIKSLWEEFEEGTTAEAKFARAVDKLDAEFHELDYKADWKGWDEQMFRRLTGSQIHEFPELHDAFEELVAYVNKHGYFDQ